MAQPLTNPEAAQFMADMSDAIIHTPTPGSSVVVWQGRNIQTVHDSIGNVFFTDLGTVSNWQNLLGTAVNVVEGTLYLVELGPFNAMDQYAQYLLGGAQSYAMSTIAQKANAMATSALAVIQQGVEQIAKTIGKSVGDLTGPLTGNLTPILIAAAVIMGLYFLHK